MKKPELLPDENSLHLFVTLSCLISFLIYINADIDVPLFPFMIFIIGGSVAGLYLWAFLYGVLITALFMLREILRNKR